jgi:hypothetical protein
VSGAEFRFVLEVAGAEQGEEGGGRRVRKWEVGSYCKFIRVCSDGKGEG